MKILSFVLIVIAVYCATWITACAPANFNIVKQDCSAGHGTCVAGANGKKTYTYTVSPSNTPIDILFVSDNSGSMSRDQQNLGLKFPAFFNIIQNLDFHVAVTTTDVFNHDGSSGQGGSLVDFGGGVKVLTPQTSNIQSLFQAGVQRPETSTCDQYLQTHNCVANSAAAYAGRSTDCSDYYNYCPNDDSRAIYATNLVVNQNESSFLRDSAPLHVVILSNSDERVVGGQKADWPLETNDLPATLIQNVQHTFNGAKSLTVHTIIIKPNDSACLNQEVDTNLLTFGQYAPIYSSLTTQTNGIAGSICSANYSMQLQQIANMVQVNLQSSLPLNCKTSDAQLTYTLAPANAAITAHVDASGQVLNFSQPIPATTSVSLNYTCL